MARPERGITNAAFTKLDVWEINSIFTNAKRKGLVIAIPQEDPTKQILVGTPTLLSEEEQDTFFEAMLEAQRIFVFKDYDSMFHVVEKLASPAKKQEMALQEPTPEQARLIIKGSADDPKRLVEGYQLEDGVLVKVFETKPSEYDFSADDEIDASPLSQQIQSVDIVIVKEEQPNSTIFPSLYALQRLGEGPRPFSQ